jgi:predicted Zn-dependent protease
MHDESELAGVLAHEIAHVTLKQIVSELNIHGSTQSPEAGFAHFFGGAGDPARIAFSQAVDKAMNILFREGLSKQDEFDADRVGTQLLAEAGYDPTALERYLARVKKAKGASTKIINHTHPPFDQRIARLNQFIVQQGMAGVKHPRLAARFESYVNGKK